MYSRRRAWPPAAGERHLSNTLVGLLNLITLVASVPIIGAGLWLQAHAGSSPCGSVLQAPLLAIGFVTLLVSLAGFLGSCYHVPSALWLYLAALLLLVLALLGITVFGLAVTAGGGGTQVPGRPYREFRLSDYSPWLQRHVQAERYWRPALACVLGARACDRVAAWTPLDYLSHDLTPIQSGCCKPPTSCTYGQQEAQQQEPDCYRWSNSPGVLCYGCDSCKAGVLEQLRRHWHNITILNVVLLLLLIAVYSCACCAFRNAATAMPASKIFHLHPRWYLSLSRWWHGRS
uniref:Tetraspanin family protein n=1 Tax=Oryza brachyantha TaxID=4533 RepID=J3L8F0_ORYBR